MRPFCYYVVEGVQGGTLGHHATGNLLVEEVDVFGVDVAGVPLEHEVGDVLERAGALHSSHTRGDLVEVVGLAQLARGQLAHAVLALATELARGAAAIANAQGGGTPQHAVAGMEAAVEGGRGEARGGAHGEIRGLVDGLADLDEVVEDGGVNGPGPRGQEVAVGQALEHLGGQLQPGSVERRDVAPVPNPRMSVACSPCRGSQSCLKLTCCDR